MGWLFHPVPSARNHDRNAEIDRIFRPAEPETTTFTIMQRSWHGNTCYVACRVQRSDTGRDYVYAAIILTKSYMENGQRWWGYKDMDETWLPYHCDAPKSLIDKLSPTDNENALKWRAACLENSAKRKKTSVLGKFRLPEPVTFSNGWVAQCFEKVHLPRKRSVYRALDIAGQPLVRLNHTDFSKAEPIA